jgi:hypothetical protein
VAALISPAGAAVRHWVRDAVDEGRPPALPALTSLPTKGSLLVDSPRGPWVVHADGSKRLLGSYDEATWSPRGLFVAATTTHQLAALEPGGAVRWTLARRGPVEAPAWSPDGYRIAYLDGSELRMVVGDGSGDRLLDAGVAAIAPSWQPTGARVLSYVTAGGTVRTMRTGDGKALFALPAGPPPSSIAWSADGSRLLVVRPGSLSAYDRDGGHAWRVQAPAGTRIISAAPAPGGGYAATVLRPTAGSLGSLRLLGPGGGGRRLFEGLGAFDDVVFSPDGRWLLLAWRGADQWLFINPDDPRRVVAIADIAAQFTPGATSAAAFPRVAGWCCPGTSG